MNQSIKEAKRTDNITYNICPQTTSSLVIPYVPSLDNKPNQRLAQHFNTRLAFKYTNSLRSNLVSNSSNFSSNNSGVYRINCRDCTHFYIGETGRNLDVRIKEHKRAVTNCSPNSGIFKHICDTGHAIDFNSASIIFKCKDLRTRRLVESAFIKINSSNTVNLDTGFFSIDSHLARCTINSIT